MVIIVMAWVLSAIMLIWELPCESCSLPGLFETLGLRPRVSNHPGRDQLAQVGSQTHAIVQIYNDVWSMGSSTMVKEHRLQW